MATLLEELSDAEFVDAMRFIKAIVAGEPDELGVRFITTAISHNVPLPVASAVLGDGFCRLGEATLTAKLLQANATMAMMNKAQRRRMAPPGMTQYEFALGCQELGLIQASLLRALCHLQLEATLAQAST